MADQITVDLITYDEPHNEFVLYLLEDGPWPDSAADWRSTLLRIQQRILAAVDVAVGGYLLEKYPDAKGRGVRIEVDSPNGCPPQLQELVRALKGFLEHDETYAKSISTSPYVSGVRLATGKEIGRFAAWAERGKE